MSRNPIATIAARPMKTGADVTKARKKPVRATTTTKTLIVQEHKEGATLYEKPTAATSQLSTLPTSPPRLIVS